MSVRILRGDCRAVLRTLPDESVHCVVTSPPYYGLRSYLPDQHPDKALELGQERTPAEYVAKLVDVFREVRRVLRKDGVAWLNLGDSYAGSWGARGRSTDTNAPRPDWEEKHGTSAPARRGFADMGIKPKDLMMIPARVAIALQDDGWWVRSKVIWNKPNPMTESVEDRPSSAYEEVFLLTRSARYFYDHEAIKEPFETDPKENYEGRARVTGRSDQAFAAARGRDRSKSGGFPAPSGLRNKRNVWTIPCAPSPIAHFAMMPPALAEICIKAGTSEKGCCLHCGTPWRRLLGEPVKTGGRSSGNGFVRPERLSIGGPGNEAVWEPTVRPTIGWRASCSCPAHMPVPCTVFDPFAGAGTTLLAADRLQRDAIGIELLDDNAAIVRERIHGDASLFAQVAAE